MLGCIFQIEMLGTDRLKSGLAVVLSCEKGMVFSHLNSSRQNSVASMMDAMFKIMAGRMFFPNIQCTVFSIFQACTLASEKNDCF